MGRLRRATWIYKSNLLVSSVLGTWVYYCTDTARTLVDALGVVVNALKRFKMVCARRPQVLIRPLSILIEIATVKAYHIIAGTT